jgi:hypothetical protein
MRCRLGLAEACCRPRISCAVVSSETSALSSAYVGRSLDPTSDQPRTLSVEPPLTASRGRKSTNLLYEHPTAQLQRHGHEKGEMRDMAFGPHYWVPAEIHVALVLRACSATTHVGINSRPRPEQLTDYIAPEPKCSHAASRVAAVSLARLFGLAGAWIRTLLFNNTEELAFLTHQAEVGIHRSQIN